MIQFHITGDSEVAKSLQGLPSKLQKYAAEYAVIWAVQPLIDKAKANLARHEKTGSLKRSISFRLKIYPRRKMTFAVVGAKRGYGLEGKEPANYAHALEFGHINRRTHKRVKAYPFMRPAWEATKSEVERRMREKFGQKLKEFITNKARKS